MSAAVWPPISQSDLLKEEEETQKAELKWLLELLQENLASLKSGLQECVALLAPEEPGTTLAISSVRTESVKGFVTRVGTRLVKGDIALRLPTLPPPPNPPTPNAYPLRLSTPIALPQLTSLHSLLNTTLDIIDISAWTGDPQNASFISGQLKLLSDTITEAKSVLRGADPSIPGCEWTEDVLDPTAFNPELPRGLSPHVSIVDGALVLVVRTLGVHESAAAAAAAGGGGSGGGGPGMGGLGGLSLRQRFGLAPRLAPHDEQNGVFRFRGADVTVREKVRVESQDPGLLAIGAKLGALGREVEGWRGRVGIVMGEELEN